MDEPTDFDDVLVPTDGSDAAREAGRQAVRFAEQNGATLHVLYAVDVGATGFVAIPSDIRESKRRIEKKGEAFVGEIESLAADADVPCVTEVRTNTPVEAITEYVDDHDVDLIVMGKRGRADPDKPWVGTTTQRVIGAVDVPVFTA